jgi:hypothetical protein
LLQQAIEAEVAEFIERYGGLRYEADKANAGGQACDSQSVEEPLLFTSNGANFQFAFFN